MTGKEEQSPPLSETSIAAIAKLCHEANAAYCRSLGDSSQTPWADAPEWQLSSAKSGVKFRLENPNAPVSSNHKNWLKTKKADGWKFGETKDPEKKLHPCMVAYDKLPIDQQFKDHLFVTIVEGTAPWFARLEHVNSLATAERDALKRSLSAQKGSATKARAVVEELKAAAKPRPIGHIDRDTDMTPAYLFELVDDADLVEIVFSDGKQEIAGLGPVVVEGDAWKMTNTGLKLHVPSLQVHGPAAGKPPYRVTGYALLLDGEQVAWSQRHEQLTIGAGQTFNLADDIVF